MATVLVCDDELINRKVASKILSKEGFDITEFMLRVRNAVNMGALQSRKSEKEIINKDSGIHFNPEVVNIFMQNIDEIVAIHTKLSYA
jgi:response regulator RpfG family c-di-GMP phosphodiesterase